MTSPYRRAINGMVVSLVLCAMVVLASACSYQECVRGHYETKLSPVTRCVLYKASTRRSARYCLVYGTHFYHVQLWVCDRYVTKQS